MQMQHIGFIKPNVKRIPSSDEERLQKSSRESVLVSV
jgi:hypothetical protein